MKKLKFLYFSLFSCMILISVGFKGINYIQIKANEKMLVKSSLGNYTDFLFEMENTDELVYVPEEIIGYFQKSGWKDPCGGFSTYPLNYIRIDLNYDNNPEYLFYTSACITSNLVGELYIFQGVFPYESLGEYFGAEITGPKAINSIDDSDSEYDILRLGDWAHDERHCVHQHLKYDPFSKMYEAVEKQDLIVNPQAIILIHGLNGAHSTWEEAITGLSQNNYRYYGNYMVVNNFNSCSVVHDNALGFEGGMSEMKTPIFTIDFSNNQNLDFTQQANELKIILRKIKTDYNLNNFILVGHSMGGLAARKYIMDYGTVGIDGLITITTPHLGSFLAYANDNEALNKKTGIDHLINSYKSYSGLDYKSTAVNMLKPTSPEMKEMVNQIYPEDLPTAVIISNWKNDFARDLSTLISLTWSNNYCNIQNECPLAVAVSKDNSNIESDGVVTIASQDLRNAIKNGKDIKPFYFYTDRFHMETNKDIECLLNALNAVRIIRHD